MIIAGYLRVSSKAQTLATQRDAIERAAFARGDVIDRWYEEKVSAKTMLRPELQRLRADVTNGGLRRVYVFRLDRLSRTGIVDTLAVVEQFRTSGVELVSVTDGFDLNGPAADVVIAVMAWGARMERLIRDERIAAARVRMEAAGEPWGRPPTMTWAQRETAVRMRREGRTVRAIAAALGVHRSVIGRAVKGVSAE